MQINDKLKYISLITLTLQNALLGLSMSYALQRSGEMFISSTAILMAEVTKLIISLILVFNEENKNCKRFLQSLYKTVIDNPIDTVKVCVPSFIYIVQNNLLYVSASYLDITTYLVTFQLKIFTTAIFSVIILNKKLSITKWISLLLLLFGVVLVQLAQTTTKNTAGASNLFGILENNKLQGLCAVLIACILSGFAGVYFEKILKGVDISIWMRNVQLSLISVPFGLLTCYFYNRHKISTDGFFFGYDLFIWYLILLQAVGGLAVAAVVKYADNILKGFATSLAIIISCIASVYIFQFKLTFLFGVGTGLVIISTFLYGYEKDIKSTTTINQIATTGKF